MKVENPMKNTSELFTHTTIYKYVIPFLSQNQ
jgi:hypothetical protein